MEDIRTNAKHGGVLVAVDLDDLIAPLNEVVVETRAKVSLTGSSDGKSSTHQTIVTTSVVTTHDGRSDTNALVSSSNEMKMVRVLLQLSRPRLLNILASVVKKCSVWDDKTSRCAFVVSCRHADLRELFMSLIK